MEHAKHMASKLTVEEIANQMGAVQSVINSLIDGDWDKHQCWSPLFECLARVESLGKLNRIKDYKEFIKSAETAIVSALNRNKATGATSFTAHEMKMVREVGACYWTLLNECTHRQFIDACDRTNAIKKDYANRMTAKTGISQVNGATT
jgi:hypothetical protein